MRSDRSTSAPLGLKIAAAGGLLFLHLPLLLIFLYAFTTEEKSYQFPPPGLTLQWFAVTWDRPDVWQALSLSVRLPRSRRSSRWCSARSAPPQSARRASSAARRSRCSSILPIALPGIITGIALRSAFSLADIPFSFWTIVLGHATFCIVVVYNNAVARFRRVSGSLIEASMDLGADGFQTFRYVILPNIGTALLAGGMLAFALSFDEVIVTTFTGGQQSTLPIWMLRGTDPPAPAARDQCRRHGRGDRRRSCRSSRPITSPATATRSPAPANNIERRTCHGYETADRLDVRSRTRKRRNMILNPKTGAKIIDLAEASHSQIDARRRCGRKGLRQLVAHHARPSAPAIC